jgi:CrcB protein
MKEIAMVFLGGGAGSIARFALGRWLNDSVSGIPFGTFAANVVGSLLIGLILGAAAKGDWLNHHTTLLLATGFCGGFTTFSTFAYENHLFLKNGDVLSFALYAVGSFVLAFGCVFLGMWLVKYF